jgi:hypothetical protein
METVKLIFGIFVIVAAIYLGVELVPPYYTNYEFQDAINNAALLATNSGRSDEAIQEGVFKQAQQLGIQISQEDIKVQRTGAQFTGSVSIEVPYTIHVNMPGYPFDLHFDPSSTNKGALQN